MNIVIVGLGVIGGSFAMALKGAGYKDVYGIDVDEKTIEKAKDLDLIKEGSTSGDGLLEKADLTIISIYPKAVMSFLKKNKDKFKTGSIITDVTGVKGLFTEKIEDILPNDVDFIFGHPMAGREKRGLDYATDKVFHGANYIITPIERNTEENIKKIEDLVLEIGFSRVSKITPEFHDEIIGYTSQLPHAMAVALMNSDIEGRDTGNFIGDSYRDLTRIANINDELWSELFICNKDNLLKSINSFELQLDLIKKAIYDDDKETLMKYFQESSRRREKL